MIPSPFTADHALILYDGVCGLCASSVNFVIPRDPRAYFRFAPLQSKLARQLLARNHFDPNQLITVVLIENNRLYTGSTAILRIARRLHGPIRMIWLFVAIPAPLRDLAYDWIARRRHHWFAQHAACHQPDPAIADRFLADEPDNA